MPFGPSAGEYLAWVYYGGGQELWREILAPHGIYSVFCSLEPPEASGWFREEIASVDDLEGLKMRFLGLGALTMQKLGVSTQLLAPADIYPALERGVIDATEFSMPAVDLDLGFHAIAKHYYLPGWHQPATLVDLMIHLPRWQELSDTHQAQIEVACRASIVDNLASPRPPVQGAAGIAGEGRAAASLASGDAGGVPGGVAGGRCRAGRRRPRLQARLGLAPGFPRRLQDLEGPRLSGVTMRLDSTFSLLGISTQKRELLARLCL